MPQQKLKHGCSSRFALESRGRVFGPAICTLKERNEPFIQYIPENSYNKNRDKYLTKFSYRLVPILYILVGYSHK